MMKINQLFSRTVDGSILDAVLHSFGLQGLHDRRTFTKHDMVSLNTVDRMCADAVPQLRQCYIPCKARTYLDDLTDKKALTVFKQVLRLHDHTLVARERSMGGRKIVMYHLEPCEPDAHSSSLTERLKDACACRETTTDMRDPDEPCDSFTIHDVDSIAVVVDKAQRHGGGSLCTPPPIRRIRIEFQ